MFVLAAFQVLSHPMTKKFFIYLEILCIYIYLSIYLYILYTNVRLFQLPTTPPVLTCDSHEIEAKQKALSSLLFFLFLFFLCVFFIFCSRILCACHHITSIDENSNYSQHRNALRELLNDVRASSYS